MALSALEKLTVTSPAFEEQGTIPVRFTGRGEDISPELRLAGLSPDAKSIAILLDDVQHPLFGIYNHWVLWNLPVQSVIPENIPHGAVVSSLSGAVQGKGYGKHKYRGPKPPFGTHLYRFQVYVLDCMLDLSSNAGKKDLLSRIEGHILQTGSLTGKFQ